MERTGFIAAALAAALTVACGGPDRTVTEDTTTVGTTGERARVENDDREFVEAMMAGNQAEIELGRLGVRKSANADVRSLGQMLIADHTKSLEKLKQIAGSHNIPAVAPDEDDSELMNRLSKLTASEFDREYLGALVDKHENTIDALQPRVDIAGTLNKDSAPVTPEPDNNQLAAQANMWAAEALPTVRMHRDHAMQLQERLEDGRNTTN